MMNINLTLYYHGTGTEKKLTVYDMLDVYIIVEPKL